MDTVKNILFLLQMEISNAMANDWTSEEALKYYIKGIDFSMKVIKELDNT